MRRLGRPYLVTCLALVAVWVLGLVALALWDPAFSGVRQGQALFWSGVAGALCAAGVAWMAVTRRAAAQGPLP